MQISNSSARRVAVSLCAVLGSATFLAACGKATVFEGQTPISIAGDPPPLPPPPPPPPEPPPPPARVELRDDRIEIREKIQFEYNKATILEVSYSLLDEIADVINKNPHVKKIQIEGHASSEGNDAYNLRLSDQRAKAVMAYLVEKGHVAPDRLVAKGFGETRPLDPADTEEAREKNRRVEFNVIEQDVTKKKVEVDPATGKEKVVEEHKESVSAPAATATPAQ
jgi:outer membrane protein OmpA-like peptidoglycan-associated protein